MRIVSILAGLWMLTACGEPPEVVPAAPVAASPVELPADSLYTLDLPLYDQAGGTAGYDRYRGHPVVVGMFYATCNHTCPMLIQNMQAFVDSLPEGAREDTRVILVSFDQDDPAMLEEVVARHKLPVSQWTLARTDPDRVRELAMLLDVSYRKNPEEGYNHTSGFAVLDRQGVMQAQIGNMTDAKAPLAKAILAMAE